MRAQLEKTTNAAAAAADDGLCMAEFRIVYHLPLLLCVLLLMLFSWPHTKHTYRTRVMLD